MPARDESSGIPELEFGETRASLPWRRLSSGDWGFARLKSMRSELHPARLFAQLELELDEMIPAAKQVAEKVAPSADSMASAAAVSGGQTIGESDLVELAIQTWRLQKRIDGLDPEEHKRIRKQLTDSARRFVRILDRFDVEFEDPTGKPYDTGWLEVEVVSWEDRGEHLSPVDSGPWVHSTVSPIIRRSGRMIRSGEIVCIDPDHT
jgi:hypothetical protein